MAAMKEVFQSITTSLQKIEDQFLKVRHVGFVLFIYGSPLIKSRIIMK